MKAHVLCANDLVAAWGGTAVPGRPGPGCGLHFRPGHRQQRGSRLHQSVREAGGKRAREAARLANLIEAKVFGGALAPARSRLMSAQCPGRRAFAGRVQGLPSPASAYRSVRPVWRDMSYNPAADDAALPAGLHGRRFVVKLGGEIMRNTPGLDALAADLAAMARAGLHVVVVHGGGAQADALAARLGHRIKVAGRRVTDDDALEVAKMVYAGSTNVEILGALKRHGARGVGLSGVDGNLITVNRGPPTRMPDPAGGGDAGRFRSRRRHPGGGRRAAQLPPRGRLHSGRRLAGGPTPRASSTT